MSFPAPGVEYPFNIGDIAYATARRLGPGWNADVGYWGTTGSIWGPYTATFTLLVVVEGDLRIVYDIAGSDAWPDIAPPAPASRCSPPALSSPTRASPTEVTTSRTGSLPRCAPSAAPDHPPQGLSTVQTARHQRS
ncbi:hypothetical protein ACGFOW_03815 [Streptomyces rubiginosohelvolus]|uniref:hypothetical protein n=1 Tax=Streptomyces rubiginosohelvolus TaxID=67362 RepID=UPI0037159B60